MNSLGVNPSVNYLYTDLKDGLILFQIFELIQPGIVNWSRVRGTKEEGRWALWPFYYKT